MLAHSPGLCGLAHNPALPPALLDALIAAADDELTDDLSRRDDLSPAQLDALAARGIKAGPSLVLFEAAPGTLPLPTLEALAHHPDPTVPEDLAFTPHLTPALAELLATHPDPDVRRAVAGNEHTPPHALAALAATADDQFAYALARNPSTPTAIVLRLADRFDLPWQLAGRPDLGPEAYERLARHPTPGIRGTVAANPAIDVPLMRVLAADDDHDVRRCLASNPAIPLDLLAALAPATRIGSTLLPRIAAATPAEVELLAASKVAEVRMWLAERPDLPPHVLARLAADPAANVVKSVAPNPALDESQLRAMLARHGVRVLARLATNPSCGPDLLHALATHRPPVPKALRKLAAHPNASAATLLLCLDDPAARPIAARHPALPVATILELLASPHPGVAEAAGANPSLPPAAMAALLE